MKLLLQAILFATAAGLAVISGSDSFDFMDGTEFVITGRSLMLPHPPGYPLYTFISRTFTAAIPFAQPDYRFFRYLSAVLAGLVAISGYFAAKSLGCGRTGSAAGSLLMVSSGPVLSQLNVVEVHGLAMFLVLTAVASRSTPLGPYAFSMSLFGGHPISLFHFPMAVSARFRERWLWFAVIPASLWLFIPLRSMLPGLCHYSNPTNAYETWSYLSLYGGRLTIPGTIGVTEFVKSLGVPSAAAMTILAVLSRRWSWRLFSAFAGSLLFLSSYSIPDTACITWLPTLPLALWASMGLSRLLSSPGKRYPALFLLLISVAGGTVSAWRRGDHAARIIAGDYLRGAPFEAAFVTKGMNTFHTAYLLEVEDRRPDVTPMDQYGCFFRIPPPGVLSAYHVGKTVTAVRAWNNPSLRLNGLLFTSSSEPPDWSIYDIFRYDGPVHDGYTMDETAEIWARRGLQSTGMLREKYREEALRRACSDITRERIKHLFEIF